MASPTPNLSFIGIVDFSEKAKWLFMTESVTELLGYEPHELIGRPSLELVHPDEFPRVKQLHYDTIQQDKAAVLVYLRMRHKDPVRGYVLCGVSRTVVHNVLVGSVSFASPGKALHNASTAQEITVITPSAANFEFRRWHDPSPMPPSPIPSEMLLPLSPAPSSASGASATSGASWDSRDRDVYYTRDAYDHDHARSEDYDRQLHHDRYRHPSHARTGTGSPPSPRSRSRSADSRAARSAGAGAGAGVGARSGGNREDEEREEWEGGEDGVRGSSSPARRRFPDSDERGRGRSGSGSEGERERERERGEERDRDRVREGDREDRDMNMDAAANDDAGINPNADPIEDRRTPAPTSMAAPRSPVYKGTPGRYAPLPGPRYTSHGHGYGHAHTPMRYTPAPPPIISFPHLPSKSFRTALILDRFSSLCPVMYASNDLLLSASSALGRSFFDFVRAPDEDVVRGWIECVKGWGVNESGQPSDGGFGFGRFGLVGGGRESGTPRMPDPPPAARSKHRRLSQSGRGARPAKYANARDGGIVPPVPTRGTTSVSRGAVGAGAGRGRGDGGVSGGLSLSLSGNGNGTGTGNATGIGSGNGSARRAPSHREVVSVGGEREEGERFVVDAIFSAHSDGLMVILRRAS